MSQNVVRTFVVLKATLVCFPEVTEVARTLGDVAYTTVLGTRVYASEDVKDAPSLDSVDIRADFQRGGGRGGGTLLGYVGHCFCIHLSNFSNSERLQEG